MQYKIEKFTMMPYSAKMGVTLWIISWAWLLSAYYYLTKDSDWATKLAIAIVILAIFITQAQNWSRLIGVVANVMGILLSLYFYLAGFAVVAAVNVVLFGGAIYYLMVPATARYFKEQSQSASGDDSPNQKTDR